MKSSKKAILIYTYTYAFSLSKCRRNNLKSVSAFYTHEIVFFYLKFSYFKVGLAAFRAPNSILDTQNSILSKCISTNHK